MAAQLANPFWPSTRSAGALLAVGTWFQISTRWLAVSATISLPSITKLLSGVFRPVALQAASMLFKSTWPTAIWAAAPLVVGAGLKISTRLLLVSVTSNWLPLAVSDCGPFMQESLISMQLGSVKLAWPSTKSAAAPLTLGKLL
ncbi:hypothetical protein D3C78_1185210 [compost metagenome]